MLKQNGKIFAVSIGVGCLVLPWLPLLIGQYSLVAIVKDAAGGIAFTLAWGAGLPAVASYGVAIIILLAPMFTTFYIMQRILRTIANNKKLGQRQKQEDHR
ncbi:hypothetical protein [Photobacterium toruni]|uniref:Uncharacterized protein n=1 Tax=Photobacterium toruni TaxID=1935446 RepID=A0A1T4STW0_9GAMM|nr:hypothetical protein [Photobacterium toruni]MEC6814616.1 hypothetical protein [Photobacterium toruni]MEC6830265.1 hypothetical protein [Photobacterium toruni]SKA31730.1 hypothetical protein CZ814_01764 [Photobacterium toruni]